MVKDQVISKISDNVVYSRKDLFDLYKKDDPEINDSSFRWKIYNLQREQKLFRIGYDEYTTSKGDALPEYHPLYSERCLDIAHFLEEKYPALPFVMFEGVLLNEFLNHQIAQNTIYVQVDKDTSAYIFDILRQEYGGGVLFKPNSKDFNRYWIKDCIVVLELVSQAPLSVKNPYEITAEKFLVDIIAEKSISAIFSPSELPEIYRSVMKGYRVDKKKMNRYAGRRGKADIVKKYIEAVKK